MGTFIKSVFVRCGGNVKIFSNLFKQAKAVISSAINNLRPVFNNFIKFMKPVVNFIKNVLVAGFKIEFKIIGAYISATVTGIVGVISGLLKSI